MKVTLFRRLKVLGIGILVVMGLSLWAVGTMMPSGMDLANRALVWALMMAGPVFGTVFGMAFLHPLVGLFIGLGWLGLLLVPAHPLRPHPTTGALTAAGLMLWFVAGFLTMTIAVWGA